MDLNKERPCLLDREKNCIMSLLDDESEHVGLEPASATENVARSAMNVVMSSGVLTA
jgi:hypothetical protein